MKQQFKIKITKQIKTKVKNNNPWFKIKITKLSERKERNLIV